MVVNSENEKNQHTMGLKRAESQVKTLLAETIISLCRNTLNYHAEISVEGLIGVTLDREEIFLVSLNQTFINQESEDKELLGKRQRSSSARHGSASSSSSDSEDNSDSSDTSTKKKRKRLRKKKKHDDCKNDNEESSPAGQEDFHRDLSTATTEPSESSCNIAEQEQQGEAEAAGRLSIKDEVAEEEKDDDDDLVVVKEELVNNMSYSQSDCSFSNIAQSYENQVNDFYQQSIDPQVYFQQSPSMPLSGSPGMGGPQMPSTSSQTPVHHQMSADKKKEGRECHLCGKRVSCFAELQRHLRVHTGEKPYQCSVCGNRFTLDYNMRTHMKRCHPDAQLPAYNQPT